MAPLYYLARTCTTLGSTCQDGEPKSDVVKAVTAFHYFVAKNDKLGVWTTKMWNKADVMFDCTHYH